MFYLAQVVLSPPLCSPPHCFSKHRWLSFDINVITRNFLHSFEPHFIGAYVHLRAWHTLGLFWSPVFVYTSFGSWGFGVAAPKVWNSSSRQFADSFYWNFPLSCQHLRLSLGVPLLLASLTPGPVTPLSLGQPFVLIMRTTVLIYSSVVCIYIKRITHIISVV